LIEESNVRALLNGNVADLISVGINQSFEVPSAPILLAGIPAFSVLVATLTVDLSLDARFFVKIKASVGIDTDGFYVRESQNDSDYIVSAGGSIGIEMAGTGRLGVLPLIKVAATPSLVLNVGVLLDSKDSDDKLRLNELLDSRNIKSSINVGLNVKIAGEVGNSSVNFSQSLGSAQYDRILYSSGSVSFDRIG